MDTCRTCKYFNGENVVRLIFTKGGAILRRRCTHPKHFNQPKTHLQKACKYFEERFFNSISVEYNESNKDNPQGNATHR